MIERLTFEPRANASRVALLVLAIAVVAGVFALGSHGVLGDTHNATAVTVDAPGTDLETGDSANVTVGIDGATDGVSAYEMTLAANDSDVATLEDVAVHADGEDGPLVHTDRSVDGAELTITVALLDAEHDAANSTDLFDVELEGRSEGPVGLEIAEVDEITDIDLETYTVGQRDGAELAVTDEPGYLVTIDDETDDRVVAGDEATVVAEVENTGETEATGELELATETEAIDTSPAERRRTLRWSGRPPLTTSANTTSWSRSTMSPRRRPSR
ncbi:hypothetical protein [Halomontanus rarus]|uniref:hypothetical protein n=1 Tax=Halomontanus rarus TaxID=3034020 RepID=UPI0023E7AD40|nr:hypothetical protein [Halovivax sp. TS33]